MVSKYVVRGTEVAREREFNHRHGQVGSGAALLREMEVGVGQGANAVGEVDGRVRVRCRRRLSDTLQDRVGVDGDSAIHRVGRVGGDESSRCSEGADKSGERASDHGGGGVR
jgi:hypothetical protein